MDLIAYKNANRNENKIALTFDDGPNPYWTEKVLDILDKHNVKANFFVLGKWAEKHPKILKEIYKRGHLIGNHTYSHPKEGEGDFDKAEKIIFDILETHTKFIRAPYFKKELYENYDFVEKGKRLIIEGDIISYDWKVNSEDIKTVIKKETQNGSIIILHDGSQKIEEIENRPNEMFKALPEIIETLKKRFEFVRLDEMNFDEKTTN